MVRDYRGYLIEMYAVLAAYQEEIVRILPLVPSGHVRTRLIKIDHALKEALSIGFRALIEEPDDPGNTEPT